MSSNNFNGNNLPQTTNGNNPFEIFNYKNLGSVRCYIDQFGMKWFCMNDVCAILEIANPKGGRYNRHPYKWRYTASKIY